MSGVDDIQRWLREEIQAAGPRRKAQLAQLSERLRQVEAHPAPDTLPAGSTQRLLARSRERKLTRAAMHLGYAPPEEQIKELGLHLAGQSLGLSL